MCVCLHQDGAVEWRRRRRRRRRRRGAPLGSDDAAATARGLAPATVAPLEPGALTRCSRPPGILDLEPLTLGP